MRANPPLCLPQLLQNDPFGRRAAANNKWRPRHCRLSLRPSTRNCARSIRLPGRAGPDSSVCVEIELLPGLLAWRSLSRRPAVALSKLCGRITTAAPDARPQQSGALADNKCSRSARSSPLRLRSAYAVRPAILAGDVLGADRMLTSVSEFSGQEFAYLHLFDLERWPALGNAIGSIPARRSELGRLSVSVGRTEAFNNNNYARRKPHRRTQSS